MVEEKEARRMAEDRAIKLLLDGEHRNEEVVESKVREEKSRRGWWQTYTHPINIHTPY